MAKKKGAAPKMEKLAIADIQRAGDTQARVATSQEVIADYAEILAGGKVDLGLPVVFHDGERYWLADGFHRVAAHELNGKKDVKCLVRPGGKRDAILFACSANADFGLRRSNADKRRAVEILLADEEWSKWSDAVVAEKCAVSRRFVGLVRDELRGNGSQPEVRKGADGKEYDTRPASKSNTARAEAKRAASTAGLATPEALSGPSKPRVTRGEAHEEPVDDVPEIQQDDAGEPVEDGAMARSSDDGPELDAEDEETPPSEQDDAIEPPSPTGPVDDAGHPIPAHLRPVFQIFAPIGDVEGLLTQAAGEFRILYRAFCSFVKEGGTDAESVVKGQQVNELLRWFDDPGPHSRRQLAHDLRAVIPALVCQTCEGEGCHECAQRGWLSASDARARRQGDEIRESVR